MPRLPSENLEFTIHYLHAFGWQRDLPIRDIGYKPSDKDSYTFGSLLYTYLVAATR